MPGWNFADVWEVVAEQIPDAQAQVHGDRRVTWAEFDRRANGVAATLLDRGAAEQDKVAQYLYNGTEYIESMFGTFKAGLVPINTNYRYQDDELVYLWDNADCVAVVFHGTFTEHHRAHPRPGPQGDDLAVGRRRRRPVPRVGHALRGGRQQPRRTGRGPVGPQRRPAAHDLHRRHDGHAQGRDVAAGRSVPQPRRADEPPGPQRRGERRDRCARWSPWPGRSACLPAR